jgi:hypothetical protein
MYINEKIDKLHHNKLNIPPTILPLFCKKPLVATACAPVATPDTAFASLCIR